MLYLKTFGGLSLAGGAALGAAGGQRKPLALLALLAASEPLAVARDHLLAFLWPERDEEHARRALRQALHALRRDLAAPTLFLGTTELRLNPEVISSDVAELEQASHRRDFPAVAELYHGPFLDGFHLSDAPEFERWADQQRRRLALIARDALEALAVRAGAEGEHRTAAQWWRRAAAIEPTNGRIALGLMRALAGTGNRAGALQHARVYEALIRDELGAEPEPEVLRLAAELRTHPEPPEAAAPVPVAPSEVPQGAAGPEPAARGREWAARAGDRRAAARRRPWAAGLLLASSLALLTFSDTPLRYRRAAAVEPEVVAVVPFSVYAPDLEEWSEGMVDVLSHSLDGAGGVRAVPPGAVLQAFGRRTQASPAELGRAVRAGTVVAGALLPAGPDSVRATLALVDALSGRTISEIVRHEATERMDRLTDSLTMAVVRALAVRHAGVAAPPLGLRSSSLEAVKLFLKGERHFRGARWDSARFYYARTLEVDSGLVLAYRRLGHVAMWDRVDLDTTVSALLLRAGQLNHGLGRRDSLLVRCDSLMAAADAATDALSWWVLARELLSTARLAAELYPQDAEAWYNLGEASYRFGVGPGLTVPETRVFRAFDRAIAADSGFSPAYLRAIELALNTAGPPAALRYVTAFINRDSLSATRQAVELVGALLEDAPPGGEDLDRLLDTLPPSVLRLSRRILRSWPDPAETAVRLSWYLARSRAANGTLLLDSDLMQQRLAQQLAFRGHLQEAYRVLGPAEAGVFVELAVLGAVPETAARERFERWHEAGLPTARWALHWWAERRDTVALARIYASARERAGVGGPAERFEAGYDTAAAQAYLALVRGDSTEALARFRSLPDSACGGCFLDRLTRARLVASRGGYREAMTDLTERLTPFSSPFQVVYAWERAQVAEGLGWQAVAATNRAFVREAWRNADPSLRLLLRRTEAALPARSASLARSGP